MLIKSKHFNEIWREEMHGRPPSVGAIEAVLDESLIIQRYRKLLTPRGHNFEVLGLYWHPDKKLVFKIDERNWEIRTVLTPETLGNPNRRIERHYFGGKPPDSQRPEMDTRVLQGRGVPL